NALEPNPFYEPWNVLPALRHLGGAELRFVLTFARAIGQPGAPVVMTGFFPLVRRRLPWLPWSMLESWRHVHCFLCTPLVRAGDLADGALAALFQWMRTDRNGAPLWQPDLTHAEGPFAWALTRVCREQARPIVPVDSLVRALCRPEGDAEAYLNNALTGKRRRDLRPQER